MCRHITTVYVCGHRIIAPTESTCSNKTTHRSGILSYFKSGKSDSACPVCHKRILEESSVPEKKKKKETKNLPVVDWLEKIEEAGAPGTYT
ncbi:hypothetical protein Q9L58_004444 [Maublancomyces gigas]|uniref:RING-Gid-type domain-containing protein n=1 Tax=Discina gigas TaxID=1032678 RepID=A0ABR3GKZ8_9PEZI